MPENPTTEFFTLPEIARRIGEPIHRVEYAVERYSITPVMRAGIIRLFTFDQIGTIESALLRTGAAGNRL